MPEHEFGHAGINRQDKVEGKTALHFAAERGVQAAVKLLLDRGASAVVADQQGRLPQDLASGKMHTLLSREAQKQGGPTTPLTKYAHSPLLRSLNAAVLTRHCCSHSPLRCLLNAAVLTQDSCAPSPLRLLTQGC